MSAKAHALTALVVFSNVAGNLLLSLGMKAVKGGALAYAKAFLSPLVLLGVTLLIVWMLSRMTLMSWADLSYILPVTAIGYVLSAMAGAIFLAEQISPSRWVGTLLIVAGIVVVSRTPSRTSAPRASARNT